MLFSKKRPVGPVLVAAVLSVSGCSSERIADHSSSGIKSTMIQAAPRGQVSQRILPPPEEETYSVAQEQMQEMSYPDIRSGESDLQPASIAGVWKAWIGGMTCQIATPQTKFGAGYRAGPLHCPDVFSGVNSWAVKGSQLVFYDNTGNDVATLYTSDGSYFEGLTSSGVQVTLSR